MALDQRETRETLVVPEQLQPGGGLFLPVLDQEVLHELRENGWIRVGLMVAFIDSGGSVMLLLHNKRDKNGDATWGPLGETSKGVEPVIEQPLATLFRGIKEELNVKDPENLDLWMHPSDGWVTNQWPYGDSRPGEYACAISFPVFTSDEAKLQLLRVPLGNEEVRDLRFFSVEQILATPDRILRPGVKNWLGQLVLADLLNQRPESELIRVDFSSIFEALMKDIDLGNKSLKS